MPPRGEVHVWSVDLDVPPATSAALSATLTEDERERCARFRFERDRRRFVVARGALRHILSRCLSTEPSRVRFAYTASGKPALSPEFGNRLRFNLSHSAERALIAITADAEVGVDLECVRPLPERAEIARHFFSAAEGDHLNQLPDHLQNQAFFRVWTRKEAYVKACGVGLESEEADGTRRWSYFTLEPAPGYVGALVVEGRSRRLYAVNGPGWS